MDHILNGVFGSDADPKRVVPQLFGHLFFHCDFVHSVCETLRNYRDHPMAGLGAALLGSIGCALLFRPWRHYKCYHQNEDFATETVEGDCINLNTSFGGSVKYINSGDFKKACLSCSFASMKVYFDHAVIQGDEAFVELNASFCGVELFVPREWRVESQASMSFGGIEEKNRNASTGTPVLHLTGHCSFGGVTIIYV